MPKYILCNSKYIFLDNFGNYSSYEKEGRFKKQIKAQTLWYAIIESQIETGTPYMLYKDACNSKSNQQNLGTIKCSNLCTEIVEYSSKDEVCRLYIVYKFRCLIRLTLKNRWRCAIWPRSQ